MTTYEKNLIEKLNLLIEEKYISTESITDALCLDLGISRSNLYRILKDNFQTSPSLYIRKIKLEKAKQLLKNTDMKISEVAYHIGLDSPQNFSKYFTQQHGINPTEYRKSLIVPIIQEPEAGQAPAINYKPIIKKPITQKHRLTNDFAFILPGLIVFILIGFGFYYWQKIYLKNQSQSSENILTIQPFECNIEKVKAYNCDTLNNQFLSVLAEKEKINIIALADSTTKQFYDNKVKIGAANYFITGNYKDINNQIYLDISLSQLKTKKVFWNEQFKMDPTNQAKIFIDIVNKITRVLEEENNIMVIDKFYLIPNKTMNTYKQYIQSNHLVF